MILGGSLLAKESTVRFHCGMRMTRQIGLLAGFIP